MKKRVHAKANTITLALLGAGALAGCSGQGTAAGPASQLATPHASPSQSPASLLHDADAALSGAKSVHVAYTLSSTTGTTVQSIDATQSSGRQVVTLDKVSRVTILDINGVAYVQGDVPSLISFLGVSQAKADEYAGQWIKVTSGETLGQTSYDSIVQGLTVPSLAQYLDAGTTPSAYPPAVIDGQHTVAVQQPAPASDKFPATAKFVLFMTDNSLRRPVLSEVTGGGAGYQNTLTFSHWNEAVHLTVPAQTVPASDVTQTSSSA